MHHSSLAKAGSIPIVSNKLFLCGCKHDIVGNKMGRKRSSLDVVRERMRRVQSLRRKQNLAPPFYCIVCSYPKMNVKMDKKEKPFVKYIFFCSNCGFKSDEIRLREPPFTVIDAFNKLSDQYRLDHQKE